MNIYAEISAKYLDVARHHDALADSAWTHGDHREELIHRGRAAGARQWSHHYSLLALDVCDAEARQEDERHVDG